jgi:transposase
MTDTQRYELIRPILIKEKTVAQVHQQTGVPVPTLYRYLSRFRCQGASGLKDKSRAPHSHPHWFTQTQQDIVVRYKLSHPRMSARQISKELTESGQLKISNHSVTNILHARGIPLTFSPQHPPLYEVTSVPENGSIVHEPPSSIAYPPIETSRNEIPFHTPLPHDPAQMPESRPDLIKAEVPAHVHTERVDDLPLLFHTLEQMAIPDLLDAHVPTHGNRSGLSLGRLTGVWLSYILSEADHRMCEVEGWADKHQLILPHLLDEPWSVKDFTDDRLAGVLRYLSDDVTWQTVESALGQHLVRIYDLHDQPVRLDSTTVSSYHDPQDTELLRFGHSKDHRPDLPQFKLMLATLDPLGLPLATLTVPGNDADDGLYLPAIAQARTVVGQGGRLYVGDAKLSCQKNRATIDRDGDYYLAPLAMSGKVPALKEQLITEFLDGKHTFQRVDSLPENRCLALAFEVERTQRLRLDGTLHGWSERVLAVYSPSLAKSQRQGLTRQLRRAEQELSPLTQPPTSGRRRWEDLDELKVKVNKILTSHEVKPFFRVTYQRHVQRRYVRGLKNRPSRYEEKVSYVLQLAYNSDAIGQKRREMGWRLYATNAPQSTLSLSKAIQLHHDSPRIERNFARIKGKQLGISPLYLQREDHIKGMVRLLSLALRVLTAMEYLVRLRLVQLDKSLSGLYAGNPRRKTQQPTTERLLRAFNDITLTEITAPSGTHRHLTPLTPLQSQILRLLGFSKSLYSQLAVETEDKPQQTADCRT